MLSLRNQLKKISEPVQGGSIPGIPHGFHSLPQSLKKAIQAMESPLIEQWSFSSDTEVDNKDWTTNTQGITCDGRYVYVVSNGPNDTKGDYDEKRAIYKFTYSLEFVKRTAFPGATQHIGAPCFYNGKFYVPSQGPDGIWILDANLETINKSVYPLVIPGGTTVPPPWCAVNPWNNCLYSSYSGDYDSDLKDNGAIDKVFAFDINNNFKYVKELYLNPKINNVAGGFISQNGRLYLVSDQTSDIRAYSVINGNFYGSAFIEDKNELEGLSIFHWNINGVMTHVHVDDCDDDAFGDDIYIKHFIVPNFEIL